MQQSAKVKGAINVDALGDQIAEMSAHIDAAMHRLLTAIREFDIASGWHMQGTRSCAHWLAWRVGWDLRTARERVRVARKLAELPLVNGEVIAASTARRLCCDAGVVVAQVDVQGCRSLLAAKLVRFPPQSSEHCGCAIATAVFPVARTAGMSTVITLNAGPTVAKPRCRTSCCCAARTIRCCTKAAAESKPTLPMARIFSIIATDASEHSQRARHQATLASAMALQRCVMPMRR